MINIVLVLLVINVILTSSVLLKLRNTASDNPEPVRAAPPKSNDGPVDWLDDSWNQDDHRIGNWAPVPAARPQPRFSANNRNRPGGFV